MKKGLGIGKRTRKQQIATLSIIAVAIITLSIGFAAFSSTLRISSQANVNPDASTFSVIFSKDGTNTDTNQTVNPSTEIYGEAATITNGQSPTLTGIKAKFTSPGQSVNYSFYAKNTGHYLAYLNYILFSNVEGESKNIVCTAQEGTSQDLVDAACEGISISIKVGADEAVTTNQSAIQNHTLQAGNSEPVVVTINYASNAKMADGAFDVEFGDISLTYSTVSDYVIEGFPEGGEQEISKAQVYKPQYYLFELPFQATIGTTLAPENPSSIPPTGEIRYLGYDVTDGVITAAYTCFVRNETEYCLKGDTEASATNIDIIKDAYSDVVDTNTCRDYTSTNQSNFSCNDGVFELSAYLNGDVYISTIGSGEYGSDAFCSVNSDNIDCNTP